jgi:predicted aspartyl protease
LITGAVTTDGVPVINVKVAGAEFLGVIDTGFNGDLELPRQLRGQVNARFLCRAESLLAGGVKIDDEVYVVDFPFDGRNIRAQATFADSVEILIGTHLLRGHRLSINFVARTVRLQRLD